MNSAEPGVEGVMPMAGTPTGEPYTIIPKVRRWIAQQRG